MLSRRDLLRSTVLAALVAGGGSALVGCGAGGGSGARSSGDGVQLVAAHVPRSAGDPAAVGDVVAALHRLGGGLLGAVGTPGNLALSPFSAGVALAMVAAGAAGTTQEQLLHLFAPADESSLDGGLDALTTYADGLSGRQERSDGSHADVTLAVANALFGQRGEQWEQDFLDILARSYGAGMQTVDYRSDPAAATTAIDSWTADHTAGRIPQIVPPGLLDSRTRLVLVDTVYLKAPWDSPFEPSATTTGDFTRADGSTVRAHLMHAAGDSGPRLLGRGSGWAATQLPYAGGELAMTIVLPDAGHADAVWADVVAGRLPTYLDSLSTHLVDLTLPRWTFRTQAALADALRDLGVSAAFSSAADFSGMTRTERLFVSQVLQQVYVAVDEGGTEAAAATAVVMKASSAQVAQAPYSFVADRPFVFAIHDVEHGTPLFVGRVGDPSSSS